MLPAVIEPRTRILGTGRYVPARVVENAELERELDTTGAWIEQHTGIQRRHVAAPGEVTSDMAAAASRAAIEAAGLTVADLDMIILATVSGDSPMPATCLLYTSSHQTVLRAGLSVQRHLRRSPSERRRELWG